MNFSSNCNINTKFTISQSRKIRQIAQLQNSSESFAELQRQTQRFEVCQKNSSNRKIRSSRHFSQFSNNVCVDANWLVFEENDVYKLFFPLVQVIKVAGRVFRRSILMERRLIFFPWKIQFH